MSALSAPYGAPSRTKTIYNAPLPADLCWNYRARLAHRTLFRDAQVEGGYTGDPSEFRPSCRRPDKQ